MAKKYTRGLYQSRKWRKTRLAYLDKVNHLCERCSAVRRYERAIIVHHKIYISPENINNQDIVWNEENFEALCHECHNKEHFEKYSPLMDGLAFDNKGNLISIKE